MTIEDRVYVITDRKAAGDRFLAVIKTLVESGFTFIQLREKDLSPKELYDLGEKIIALGGKKRVRLVINDRVDVALALKAYGVQLTEKSLQPEIVKSFVKKIKIGLSVHDLERVKRFEEFVDFFVFGNVFETESHPGRKGKGLEELKRVVLTTRKPVYAIGGITKNNILKVKEQGAYGVAIRGAFFSNPYLEEEIEGIKEILAKVR